MSVIEFMKKTGLDKKWEERQSNKSDIVKSRPTTKETSETIEPINNTEYTNNDDDTYSTRKRRN